MRAIATDKRGSRGVTVNLLGQSVDSTMVASQVAQPEKPRLTELKGLIELTGHVFSERWNHLFGFFRTIETRRRRSVDSKRVVRQMAAERGRALAQSKGLVTCASAEPQERI